MQIFPKKSKNNLSVVNGCQLDALLQLEKRAEAGSLGHALGHSGRRCGLLLGLEEVQQAGLLLGPLCLSFGLIFG